MCVCMCVYTSVHFGGERLPLSVILSGAICLVLLGGETKSLIGTLNLLIRLVWLAIKP